MDSQQTHHGTTYASKTVPKKSKFAGKKPPAPPPRKSSVPNVSQGMCRNKVSLRYGIIVIHCGLGNWRRSRSAKGFLRVVIGVWKAVVSY